MIVAGTTETAIAAIMIGTDRHILETHLGGAGCVCIIVRRKPGKILLETRHDS
jgi:hypothetical protein